MAKNRIILPIMMMMGGKDNECHIILNENPRDDKGFNGAGHPSFFC